jgi:hypothetical protein
MTSSVGIAVFPDDGSRAPDPQRRHCDAPREGCGRQLLAPLRPGNQRAGAVHLARRSGTGALRRRAARALPTQIDLRTGRGRRRGARAVGAPDARPAHAGGLRAPGRGVGSRRRGRHVGDAPRVPSSRGVGRRWAASAPYGCELVGPQLLGRPHRRARGACASGDWPCCRPPRFHPWCTC